MDFVLSELRNIIIVRVTRNKSGVKVLLTRTLSTGWSVLGVFDRTSHRFSVPRSILLISHVEFPLDATAKSSTWPWRNIVEWLGKRHILPFNCLVLE